MKGKTYPDEIKEQVLKKVEETGNVALVARNHGIPSTTINTWNSKKKKLKKKMISLKIYLVKKTLRLQSLKTF